MKLTAHRQILEGNMHSLEHERHAVGIVQGDDRQKLQMQFIRPLRPETPIHMPWVLRVIIEKMMSTRTTAGTNRFGDRAAVDRVSRWCYRRGLWPSGSLAAT